MWIFSSLLSGRRDAFQKVPGNLMNMNNAHQTGKNTEHLKNKNRLNSIFELVTATCRLNLVNFPSNA
jgi:hypothetical protein